MCNWMQGHNDILGFKAFICHDGILDTKNAYFGTEEIYFAVRLASLRGIDAIACLTSYTFLGA